MKLLIFQELCKVSGVTGTDPCMLLYLGFTALLRVRQIAAPKKFEIRIFTSTHSRNHCRDSIFITPCLHNTLWDMTFLFAILVHRLQVSLHTPCFYYSTDRRQL